MKVFALFLLSISIWAQNYASYNNQPVARMSFLRHQPKPSQNAFRDSSMIGYWPLSEGAGAIAYDESGNGNSGVWSGIPSGTNRFYSAGKTSTWAGTFDGSASYVAAPYNAVFSPTSQMTVAAWVKTNTLGGSGDIVSRSETGGYIIALNDTACGSNTLIWAIHIGSSYTIVCTPSTALATGWHLVAATYDGITSGLYIDGTLANSTAATGTITYAFNNALCIGMEATGSATSCSGRPFSGQISNVRLYNRALSTSEIQAIYNAENH